MFPCYSNSWCISTNIAQPVQTVISVNLLWLKQDSIFCFEGEGLSKYILFSFWPLWNQSCLDNVWTWSAFYLRIKLPQRVLKTTGTPHASSPQRPPTVRGLNRLCLLNNLKFFVLVARCDVFWSTHSRQQPHCVSRPSFRFCEKHSHQLSRTLWFYQDHPARHFPLYVREIIVINLHFSLNMQDSGRFGHCFTFMHSKWVGWIWEHWAVKPVNTPASHFPSLSGITLCVFHFPSCVSFCFVV